MTITVLTFGSLTELLDRQFTTDAPDTGSLMESLFTKHPALRTRRLLIAVNHAVIQENTILREHDQVAIMPPYSGG